AEDARRAVRGPHDAQTATGVDARGRSRDEGREVHPRERPLLIPASPAVKEPDALAVDRVRHVEALPGETADLIRVDKPVLRIRLVAVVELDRRAIRAVPTSNVEAAPPLALNRTRRDDRSAVAQRRCGTARNALHVWRLGHGDP